MNDLSGQTAVVTGAGSGIGRGTALALARAGVNVAAVDIDAERAEAVAAEIEAAGAGAVAIPFDVSRDDFAALRDRVLERFGRIDIVMNNVGALTNGLPDEIPLEEWQRIIELNLLSIVKSNLAFLPGLKAQRSGHVINTASFAGLYTYAFDRLPYAACKAAIVQISEGLAIYLRPFDVYVTLLCPGPVRTNISASVRSFGQGTALRTPGAQFALMEADDVGALVVEAVRERRFMVPTHPAVRELLVDRASDWDAFLQEQIDRPTIVQVPR